ncbi:prolyl oligopeptidase family serine peptidase [bacterium]|nr:prolyl oligopeptidase family serine peptidase [bacterium]
MQTFLRLVVLTLLCCAAMLQAEEPAPVKTLLSEEKYVPDIATFLQIGAWGATGHTWDGKQIYVSSSLSGEPQVYRLTESGWPYQLTTFEDGMDGFSLSYNGTYAIVSASVGGDENSQLYLMDPMTGRLRKLTDKPEVQYGSVTTGRDESKLFYRSNEENGKDFFIYEMNIATGESRKVFDGVPGSNGIESISDDCKHLIVGNWTSNVNCDLYHVNLSDGKWKQISKDKGDVIYTSVTLMPDNQTLWLTCNDNKDGMMRIATMTVKSPKLTWLADGWVDAKWECDGMYFSRDYKYQAAVINEDGYGRAKVREVATKKDVPLPKLDGQVGVSGFLENGDLLLSFSSPTRAPDVYRWSPAKQELKQLTQSIYAGIDRTMFREPALVRIKSFDGLEIPCFLYLPPTYEEGKPVPFIVDAHGGPESQFTPGFIRNFQYLMLNGYGILAPNPRGSSGYGRDYLALDNYKKRKDSLKDYKACTEWLIERGYTKQGMIAIRGGSYGGYVALGMITEYPDLYSAAVDNVGIANFQTFLQNTAAYRRAIREAEYGPLTDPDFLHEISPIHKANLIKTPLFVVHGANDPRVPVGEARQILEAVAANGVAVDSLIFADEGHGSAKKENIIEEYRRQVEFFNTHLKKE